DAARPQDVEVGSIGLPQGGRTRLADDLGGDALPQVAVGAPVKQQGAARLSLGVYEARRDDAPGGVHLGTCLVAGQIADSGDTVADDAHIGAAGLSTGAVHHHSTPYQKVE